MELRIKTLTDLKKSIPKVLEALGGRRKIALYGEMGAGKTTFTTALARYLGVKGTTASPTFSLVNEYPYPGGIVRHLDLYRLQTVQEAFDIGIEDFLYDAHYCIIEWPQLIEDYFPENAARIALVVQADGSRTIRVENVEWKIC
jgi:tRNA threonylcarbamoyladenosine biosynthesis protein TsaE